MSKQQEGSHVQERLSKNACSDATDPLTKGRRRFIKQAIVTVPVILTVTSRPVWARNCTWSGQLSGNLSDAGLPCGGEGCNTEFWRNNTGRWHYDFCVNKYFDEVFGITAFPDATLFDVINGNIQNITTYICNNGTYLRAFGAEAVAALQNSATRVSFDWYVCEVTEYFRSKYEFGNCDDIDTATGVLSDLNNNPGGCPL